MTDTVEKGAALQLRSRFNSQKEKACVKAKMYLREI